MQECEMSEISPPRLRLNNAGYFYSQYLKNSGLPRDSYFHMVAYFDAFLFSLISIEEMVSSAVKDRLKNSEIFMFMKALRNINAHHSVIAASQPDSRFVRPFIRYVHEETYSSLQGDKSQGYANLAVDYEKLRFIFNEIEKKRPCEKKTLDIARQYLLKLESTQQPVFIEHVFNEAIKEIEAIVA